MAPLKILKKRLTIVVSVLFVIAVFAAVYVFSLYLGSQKEMEVLKQQVGASGEVMDIIEKVSRLIALPGGESPQLATVTDTSKLAGQPFYKDAQEGDKVLVYANAKKAFLYRPSEDRLIEVAPIKPQETTISAEVITEPVLEPVADLEPASFYLLNGTSETGLTFGFETRLTSASGGASVVGRDDASRSDYEESLIVDLSGSETLQALNYATALGLKVGDLPEGEIAPQGADFLVILGQDQLSQ